MSRLDELIQKYCPDGVQFLNLKSVSDIKRGERITKKQLLSKGKYPVKSGGVGFFGNFNQYNRVADTITVAQYGSAGYVDYIEEKFWANDVCYSILPIQNVMNNKFLYYCLSNLQNYLYELTTKAIPDCLPMDRLEKVKIPVPPLPVQEEIVRILDTFTELTAELQTQLQGELQLRKKQYEYYLNRIINSIDAEELKLGDVCSFTRGPFGGSLKKECFQQHGYAVYEQQHAIYSSMEIRYFISEEKFQELKRFEVKQGDLIVSCSGTIGKVFIIPSNAPVGIINQALLKLTPSKRIDAKYLKYYFENTISAQLNDAARGGAIRNVPSVAELKNLNIRVPSISEQKKIVSVLDHFNTLCNDLTSGLPAEIENRQKQYEYYRDKLLTFKPLP